MIKQVNHTLTGNLVPDVARARKSALESVRAVEEKRRRFEEGIQAIKYLPIEVIQDLIRTKVGTRDVGVGTDEEVRVEGGDEKELFQERAEKLRRRIAALDSRLNIILRTSASDTPEEVRRKFRSKPIALQELYQGLFDSWWKATKKLREIEDPGCTERERGEKKKRTEIRKEKKLERQER